MKKIIILYSFLIFQIIINAQQNDITSLKFSWINYPEFGRVDVQTSVDYSSPYLIRWNDDKIVLNYPIYLYTFYTDTIPSNLIGQENDINLLLSDAVSNWNYNYNIKIEINDYVDKAVHAYFSDADSLFRTASGEYAQAITKFPVIWNSSKQQFER